MMDNRNRTLRYKEWPKKTQGTPLKKSSHQVKVKQH